MIYGLYNSAAGMLTSEYRQAVLANNLANADTVGFKREIAVFAERAPAAVAGERSGPSDPGLAGLSGGMWLGRTHTDYSEGTLVQTGNPLDIAINGPGLLTVNTGKQVLYTRDGRLLMNTAGRLVAASDGAEVLGQGGVPVQLNPYGGPASIDDYGQVQQNGHPVGQLALVAFPPAALQKVGEGRYAAPAELAQAAPTLVQAGYVENSGVQPLQELVSMIDASRAYQMNAQMISLQDQTASKAIGIIAR
jgi:flagellar basal-body rod protein FlgF